MLGKPSFSRRKTAPGHRRDLKGLISAIDKSQAVIEFDLEGTILFANENFLQTMGYSLDEIRGRHHRIFVDPAEAAGAEYAEFWNSLRQGRFQTAEYRRLARDGREVWIQASYNPLLDGRGRPYKVVKLATDITRQKLRNADYRGQIEAIGRSQAVIEFDLDGTILHANDNFLAAMGYTLDEIRGRHHSMFAEADHAASEAYRRFWEALGRGEFQAGEYRRLGKDGREVWIQATYNPILDPSGRPFKVVKYATDITRQVRARQKAERVGRLVDEKLERILSSVASANERSTAAASASDQTLSTVQAVASATEEFEATAREIAQSMATSRAEAERAMQETGATDQSTQRLSSAAQSMATIVEVIQDIANQINLLALNATIESARAGEAGRGFAVVASEVKALAGQVGKATEKISQEISGVQSVATEVVERLGSIRGSVESVQMSVSSVAGSVEEQSAAIGEIATNMNTASTAVGEINASLASISEAIRAANGLSEEGLGLYRELKQQEMAQASKA